MTVGLIGPPAAGKSRVGRRLARRLDLPFTDTDAVIVRDHGPISQIFAVQGEPAFRALERAPVVPALATLGIVTGGGGAVLVPLTHADRQRARVVLLTVSPEAVAARIDDGKRPLVQGIESWLQLVAKRMPLYESLADYRADTSRRPISTIVEEIAEWLQQQEEEDA